MTDMRHVKRCLIIIIITIIIETAGTWHEMATELTQEIGRRITTITEDTRETTFLFQRLSREFIPIHISQQVTEKLKKLNLEHQTHNDVPTN